MKFAALIVAAAAISGVAGQAKRFTYAGVGLTSDLKAIARRYQSPTEAMTLICFVGPRRTLLAEAVIISRR